MAQEGVNTLEEPSLCHDCNLTGHLWDELDRAVDIRIPQPANLIQMEQALQEEWENIEVRK